MIDIASNLESIHKQIIAAEQRFGGNPSAICLLAVSKNQPVAVILRAIEAGQHVFGENYLQGALPKIAALSKEKIEWHFIGAIQKNKTRAIAEHFHWVQSIDRVIIAERLNEQRLAHLPPLNVCIQVNVEQEVNKAGVTLDELLTVAQAIAKLPRLQLRGLMAIPKPGKDFAEQRATFHKVRLAFDQLRAQGFALDTLSMGMSDDFVAAIAEGATMIRLGTLIFGPR